MIINKKRCLNGIITFLASCSLSLLHNGKNKSTSILVKRLNGTKLIYIYYCFTRHKKLLSKYIGDARYKTSLLTSQTSFCFKAEIVSKKFIKRY